MTHNGIVARILNRHYEYTPYSLECRRKYNYKEMRRRRYKKINLGLQINNIQNKRYTEFIYTHGEKKHNSI